MSSHPVSRSRAAGRLLALAWLVGAALAGTPAPGGGQATGAPVRLGVEEAVARAVRLSEEVLIARAEQARAEGLVREVRARSLPSLSAEFDYTRNIQRPVLFFNTPDGVQQISIGNDNDYTFGLRLEQSLLDFSLGPARRAARLSAEAGEAEVEAARTGAALRARLAYYAALLDRELVTVQEKALAQARARLEQVEMMHRAGTASDFDLLTAQVEVENIRPQLIEARNRLALDLNELKRAVDLPIEAEIALTDSLAPPEAFDPPSLEEAAALAIRWRPDLRAQQALVDLQRQNLTAQRRAALPAFDLFATLTRRGSSDAFFPGERDFSQSATLGVSFSLPLFDGRERAGLVQQAEAATDRERFRLERVEEEVRLEVQQALQNLESAGEQVTASASNVRRAERALEIAQTRFRNGLSTQVELNDAELAATRARTNHARALYAFHVARARLRAALGER